MTYDELQQQLGRAGLTLQEFAEIVKMNRTSVYNYRKSGEVPTHLAVIAVLLRVLTEQGIDYREALSEVELVSKKPRGAGVGKFGGDKTE